MQAEDGDPGASATVGHHARQDPEADPRAEEPAAEPHAPARPPVLGSEALRRDLLPTTPGRRLMRGLAIALGAVGATTLTPLAATDRAIVPVAGAFAAIALLGVPPMPYAARASALLTVSAGAFLVATWSGVNASATRESLLLDLGVVLLAAGLCLRAWHRASLSARALVALGVAVCVSWLALTHAVTNLLILEAHWQSWLPRVVAVPLVLLLMLCLLAFMNAGTTAGAGTWAGAVLGWYALERWIPVLASAWPVGVSAPALWRLDSQFAVSGIAKPLLAALLAVAAAQLLAVAASRAPRP